MAAPDWDVGADFVRVAIVVSNNVKRSRMLVSIKGGPSASVFAETPKFISENKKNATAVIQDTPQP